MRTRTLLATIGLLWASPASGATFPVEIEDESLNAAIAWFEPRTRADGCIGPEPTGSCSHASTRDVVLALSAAGRDPRSWAPSGADPVTYLRDHRQELEAEPTGCPACVWAETVVVLASAGEDPRSFGGFDYVARLDDHFDGVQMGEVNQINDDAWALMAYVASEDADASKKDALRRHLEALQNPTDGGWSWNLAPQSEAWGTATVALALEASGTAADSPVLDRAVTFLKTQQSDSGLIVQDGSESAESTALTIQLLQAIGKDPLGPEWVQGGHGLAEALLALQSADGSFAHNSAGGSAFLATTQVLPGLRGVPYPFRPPTAAILVSPPSGNVSTRFEFRSASSDPDGTITGAWWRFSDGGQGQGERIDHTFSTVGLHSATLWVEDDDGVARPATHEVDVLPVETQGTGATAGQSVDAEPDATVDRLADVPQGTASGAGAMSIAFAIAAATILLRRRR